MKSRTAKLDEHVRRFDEIYGRLDNTEGTLHVVKTDLELIKKDLKQKVDYDDFAALEERVRHLETKSSS